MTQRDAEIMAAWAARLAASNPQPAPEAPATPYTCGDYTERGDSKGQIIPFYPLAG